MNIKQSIKRVRAVWAELDYAQRRLFEIRTGVPVLEIDTGNQVSRARPNTHTPATIDELEALFAAEEAQTAH
jgi:hypothetical protein